ncbi:MAG: DUF1800 family protein [Acidobacteriota bacterium]|nr:DUF1800 family protein [Acidobacteriota bacterium]
MFPIRNPRHHARRLLNMVLVLAASISWAAVPCYSLAGQEVYTVSAGPTTVNPGQTINVSWTAPAGRPANDWIGLYVVGDPDTSYLSYQYTAGAPSGSLPFAAPAQAGQYEFRYFTEDSYNRVSTSNAITVTGGTPTFSLSASPTTVNPGQAIMVSWAAPAGRPANDWVGLYVVGDPDTGYLSYQYTAGAPSGSLPFAAPAQAGQYEFRYFTDDSYNRVATSNTVTVGGAPTPTPTPVPTPTPIPSFSVMASPSTVNPGQTITVTWTAPAGRPANDWVGLYKVGDPETSYLSYQYTAGAASGNASFTAPGQAGQYEVRYFTDDSYNRVATSNTVTVTGSGPSAADTVRFLEQATFGPTSQLVESVQNIGFEAYLNEQFNGNVSGYAELGLWPATRPDACTGACQRDNYTMYPLQKQFYTNALYGSDQVRQRVAFALHKIFVVSGRDFGQPSHVAPYLRVIDRNAFGNFRTLLEEITLNTAMGYYLDMRRSTRTSPNENYAREILQLFSTGLNELNEDGTPRLDGQGNPIPVYDQEIVNEFSKAFTGWFEPANVSVTYSYDGFVPPTTAVVPNYITPMRVWTPEATYHHPGQKRLLNYPGAIDYGLGPGVLPPNQSTVTDLNRSLDNIYNHPSVAPFICKQLIQQLVTSNPSPAYVGRISAVFNSNRTSDRQLFEVVKAILLDTEARGAVKSDPNYGKLREPVLFITNLIRAFNGNSDGVLNNVTVSMGPAPNINVAIGSAAMEQDVLRPQTVFSYFPPDYEVPDTSLIGPEFGISSTVTTLTRANFVHQLVFSGIPAAPPDRPNGTQLDLNAWLPLVDDPQVLVSRLDELLLHGTISNDMRSRIINAVNVIPADTQANRLLRVRQALYLVATSSQYQVER